MGTSGSEAHGAGNCGAHLCSEGARLAETYGIWTLQGSRGSSCYRILNLNRGQVARISGRDASGLGPRRGDERVCRSQHGDCVVGSTHGSLVRITQSNNCVTGTACFELQSDSGEFQADGLLAPEIHSQAGMGVGTCVTTVADGVMSLVRETEELAGRGLPSVFIHGDDLRAFRSQVAARELVVQEIGASGAQHVQLQAGSLQQADSGRKAGEIDINRFDIDLDFKFIIHLYAGRSGDVDLDATIEVDGLGTHNWKIIGLTHCGDGPRLRFLSDRGGDHCDCSGRAQC